MEAGQKGSMAPKAKPKAKGGARPKAKVKAMAAPRGRGLLGVLRPPGAAAVVRKRRGHLRRPASEADGAGVPGEDAQERWEKGLTVLAHEISMDALLRAQQVVFKEASYFHAKLTVAGKVLGALTEDGRMFIRLKATGTQNEELLKVRTADPKIQLRVHLRTPDCNREETATDFLHGMRVRPMRSDKAEDPWTSNLEGARPEEKPDELAALREKFGEGGEPKEKEKKESKRSKSRQKIKKEKKKKIKDKGKEKKEKARNEKKDIKKKAKKKESSSESSSSGAIPLDGSQPKRAAVKSRALIFGGIGMDTD